MQKRSDDLPSGDGAPRKSLSSGAEFAGVGLQMGAMFGVGAWLGHYLDGRFGTTPWLTIVLVFLSAGAAFFSIYRRIFGGGDRR